MSKGSNSISMSNGATGGTRTAGRGGVRSKIQTTPSTPRKTFTRRR